MKIRYKEDPKEWRKSVLLAALGLAVLSSILRFRKVLPSTAWLAIIVVVTLWTVLACLRPGWFRGYYRFSLRIGVALSQVVARVVLVLVFALLVTPLGLLMRLGGKDLLGLKRPRDSKTYWSEAKETGDLDRLF